MSYTIENGWKHTISLSHFYLELAFLLECACVGKKIVSAITRKQLSRCLAGKGHSEILPTEQVNRHLAKSDL